MLFAREQNSAPLPVNLLIIRLGRYHLGSSPRVVGRRVVTPDVLVRSLHRAPSDTFVRSLCRLHDSSGAARW